MPINVNNPEYSKAEREFHESSSIEEQMRALQKMISFAPKHKGAENLRAQLKTKYKKLKEKLIKSKKSGKSTKQGIKKHEMQAVLLGFTNSGKSSLLSALTNANPKISPNKFSTTSPIIGMMAFEGAQIQLIENPAIDSEFYDKGLTNTADTILILINNLQQLQEIKNKLETNSKKIIIFNNKEKFSQNDLRKIAATLQSKKNNFIIISKKEDLKKLKEKIFKSFDKIRVYTKEPGKQKTNKPIILQQGSTIKDVSEKILHGFANQIRETRVTGPSSKFPNQKVKLTHKLKDLDVVEFKTR